MQKENLNAAQNSQTVMCAAVRYLKDASRLSNFRTLDQDVQELISVLLLTDFLEEKELRQKLYQMLEHAKFFTEAFKDFTDDEINVSLKTLSHDCRS